MDTHFTRYSWVSLKFYQYILAFIKIRYQWRALYIRYSTDWRVTNRKLGAKNCFKETWNSLCQHTPFIILVVFEIINQFSMPTRKSLGAQKASNYYAMLTVSNFLSAWTLTLPFLFFYEILLYIEIFPSFRSTEEIHRVPLWNCTTTTTAFIISSSSALMFLHWPIFKASNFLTPNTILRRFKLAKGILDGSHKLIFLSHTLPGLKGLYS
jgi:hypothetical protein